MREGKGRFLGRSEEGDSERIEEVIREFVGSRSAGFGREQEVGA